MGFSRQEHWSGLPLPSLDPTPRHSDSIDLGQGLAFKTVIALREFGYIARVKKALEPDYLASNPDAITYQLCNLGQVT